MKLNSILLIALSFLSASAFALSLPGLENKTSISGVGVVAITDSSAAAQTKLENISACSVSLTGNKLTVLAEIDPGFGGHPVEIDLETAVKEELEGSQYVAYRLNIGAQAQNIFCGMKAVTSGDQTLVITSYEKSPIYSLKSEMVCSDGDTSFTKTYIAKCDTNFSPKN